MPPHNPSMPVVRIEDDNYIDLDMDMYMDMDKKYRIEEMV